MKAEVELPDACPVEELSRGDVVLWSWAVPAAPSVVVGMAVRSAAGVPDRLVVPSAGLPIVGTTCIRLHWRTPVGVSSTCERGR